MSDNQGARVSQLETQVADLKRKVEALVYLITVPAPGDPRYEEALAKAIPFYEQEEAKERAANNPPTWTARRRAEASLRGLRSDQVKKLAE